MKTLGWLVLGMLIPVSLVAWAGEHDIKESDVPRPVLDALKKEFPTGKPTVYEREQEDYGLIYEIKLTDGPRNMQVEFDPTGKLLEKEEILPTLDAVPAAVKDALAKSKYADWTVKRVKRVIVPEPGGYALNLTNGDSRAKLRFDAKGTLLGEKVE